MSKNPNLIKGRGAQINTANPYLNSEYTTEHHEGLDEPFNLNAKTMYYEEFPKKIVNKVDSPDLGLDYSMNPYQGCEHGCIYCYARNTHQYWGFSAGMDFEKRISLKEEMNSAELKDHIKKLQLRGANNIEYYSIELFRRTSDAFTVFILTLIGVSLASRKVRGGLGLHIVLGFLLSSTYIIFMRFSTTFSTNGDLSPFVSVWIPNLIFAGLAIVLMQRAPK